MITLLVLLGVAATSSTSPWLVVEAVAAILGVGISAAIASYQLIKARGNRKMSQSDKLDSVVLALAGRPASPDGTFEKIDGLVDNFKDHRAEVLAHQAKVDADIVSISERLEYVASQYVTNGGSTVKDDLVSLRTIVADLRQTVKSIAEGQNDARIIAETEHIIVQQERDSK